MGGPGSIIEDVSLIIQCDGGDITMESVISLDISVSTDNYLPYSNNSLNDNTLQRMMTMRTL